MAVPVIETARLRLRGLRESDLEGQARLVGNPNVMRHVGGYALNREDGWRRLLAGAALWPILGYGYWGVERRDNGAWIGQTGFADFKREMNPSIEGLPEMGWMFLPEAHGQGYASEAVSAGLKWADENLGRHDQFVAIIDPENAASIRLAERMGFGGRKTARYHDDTVLIFRRNRAG